MAATADDHPGVSYVMPVLNEADYLEAAVASIVAQAYPGEWELVLAVGPSTDGTDAVVARLVAADERIRTVGGRLVVGPGPPAFSVTARLPLVAAAEVTARSSA